MFKTKNTLLLFAVLLVSISLLFACQPDNGVLKVQGSAGKKMTQTSEPFTLVVPTAQTQATDTPTAAPDFSIPTVEISNAIYSWWVTPIAVRYVGKFDKTYIGFTDRQGFGGVISVDNRTGRITQSSLKTANPDDHGAVSVAIMPDGRIIAAYSTGHNEDSFVHVRISIKPENVESFGPDVVINAKRATTYSQLIYKNKTWWLFFRMDNSIWAYTSSPDGQIWSEPTLLVNGKMQYYVKVVDTTDANLLRLVMYSNPNAGDENIRLGFFDTQNKELVLPNGTFLGKSVVYKEEFPIILPVEPGKNQRLLDVAVTDPGTTFIGYAVFSNAFDAVYMVAQYKDGEADRQAIIAAGRSFYLPSKYVGGLVFGQTPDVLYLSRNEGKSWMIERWISADTPFIYHRSKVLARVSGKVAIRPMLDLNGDGLLWVEGSYDEMSFANFDTNIEFASLKK